MGFYFRKRLGLGPLNVNFSRSGVGLSLGVRGFRVGMSSSGRRYISAGLPGTELYYRQFVRKHPSAPQHSHTPHPAPAQATTPSYPIVHPHNIGWALGYAVGWLLILSPIALLMLLVLRLMR